MIKILELFAGIGACSKAFENLGIPHEIVDAVEIDKYAIKSFNAIHGTDFKPQDIKDWNKNIDVDLIMHGSPCQDFSIAGKGAGGDKDSGTRSSLMYETLRIVEKLQPQYVIWENVKNILSKKHYHNFLDYFNSINKLGYITFYKVLNAKDYGIPQNRERVFTISIRNNAKNKRFYFPNPFPLEKKLKDVLDDNVDEKYYISDKQLHGMIVTNYSSYKLSALLRDKNDIANTIKARFEGNPQLVEDEKLQTNDKMAVIEPICIASRGRNHVQHLEPRKDNLTNTITSVQKDNYVAEPKVIGGIGEKKSNGGTQWFRQDRVYDDKVATSVTAAFNPYYKSGYRIRKLTPKECWRLMGFDDSDFEKAEKVNSNTQLYKQAGNSIVVNVLEEIIKNLILS